jgi:cysteinyl-tRNA synthetase
MKSLWKKPAETGFRTGLHIYNSLTKTKEEFLTITGDRRVYWYMCGPTVYSDTHMGHARTYITSDIIRRILVVYFGYQVTLCMNITDIDDKIINTSIEKSVSWDVFARNWEKKFFEDMDAVNVGQPDILTRVSEYIPEIIQYVGKIIDNGYAYESNNSVYFDTNAFKQNHDYCKLDPKSADNEDMIKEAEGNADIFSNEKKKIQDFALWKKSKEGEPAWESPYGHGRPGWHIECSAMASDVLPFPLDLHSGGIDLRFPHHDNEIAQCEAYYNTHQWVNYFLHTGHLHINGLKMSRSLKNFITIKEVLKLYSPRQLRMFFLLNKWDGIINYSETSLQESIGKEKKFNEFLMNTASELRKIHLFDAQKLSKEDKDLLSDFEACQSKIHEALCDNLSTDVAIEELSTLVNKTNSYIQASPKFIVLSRIRKYVLSILETFGLEYSHQDSSKNQTEPLMEIVCDYRDKVKNAAKEKNFQEIFRASDEIRDQSLPSLGIIVEDLPGGKSRWKTACPDEILLEAKRKAAEEEKKNEIKQKKQKALDEKKSLAKIKAEEMFLGNPKYSIWDEKGIPTHLADGNPISKSDAKKLAKLWEKQKALNESN